MKKLILIISIVLSITLTNKAQKHTYYNYKPNTIILKIKPEYKSQIQNKKYLHYEIEEILSEDDIKSVIQKFPNSEVPNKKTNIDGKAYTDITTIYEIEIDENRDIFEIINRLKETDIIDYAHPYYIPELLYVPNDPLNSSNQWYIEIIKAYEAFDIHRGDTNFVVGISDTGTDIDHPDLLYNIAYNWNDPIDGIDNDNDGFVDNFRGWDLAENDNNPQAEASEHGIWVSGLCAPETDNGIGLTGAAYNCKFLPLKISDSDNILTMAYESIVYAADHDCNVINCSWGSLAYMEMAQDIINYATINRNALVIGACGNNHNEELFYPASYDYVFSIAATTELDQKWSPDNTGTTGGSTYNYRVDLSAPGAMVYTTNNGGYTTVWGGTSFAAPIVAGAATLVWSYYPDFSALQVKELLKISADNIDTVPDNAQYAGKLGAGRLNMYKALNMEHTPSLVLEKITIEDDRENDYTNSDTVLIKGILTNYLAPASNLKLNISCDNPNIEIISEEINLGTIGTLEFIDFENEPIKFKILNNLDYNSNIMLRLDYQADNYEKTQYIEVFVKPSYKQLNANNISISIPCNGRIGFVDQNCKIGKGMIYNQVESLFYDCALIMGTNSETVSSAVRQESDFFTQEQSQKFAPGIYADQEIVAKFNDSCADNSMGIDIFCRAMAWNNPDYNNFIILEYDFINATSNTITNFYAGLFADWDLISAANNKADLNVENQLFYFWHTGNQSMYSGMQILNMQNRHHYALENIEGGDGVIDITDDFSKSEKFHVISNSQPQAGEGENGNDIVGVISAGPFSIESNDTLTMAFAFHAASNFYDLSLSAQKADYLYNEILHPSSILDDTYSELRIYPNPSNNKFKLALPDNMVNRNLVLTITDMYGKVYLKSLYTSIDKIIEFDTNLSTGVYIINIRTDSYNLTSKLIIKD
ncbi:MAG: S8 family peptidase [Bacteroidales bacterium]|nr:S8 family peptidase [Bacteroidales bacterium]